MPTDSHASLSPYGRPRKVIDHQLDRQRVLRRVRSGDISAGQVRNATPSLMSSADVLGTVVERACPLCGAHTLRETLWIHGAALGEKSGTARSVREIDGVVEAFPELIIHTVEVCMTCRWNFLIREDIIGSGSAFDNRPGDSIS
ncbi:DUF5318 family protein [Corynebacterium falsenii]|uniref:DUF5318 family protein n=1 Tax=Corynebacterium falsenii TaxID=108486 RepID=UPI003FD5E98C